MLGLPGEWVVELGGLDTTDADSAAVELFAAHVRRAQAGRELNDAERDTALQGAKEELELRVQARVVEAGLRARHPGVSFELAEVLPPF